MTGDPAAGALEMLAPYRSLLLAVSGGPDSVALMLLCAAWRARSAHAIAVATVDHGLRATSRSEAVQVGDWARALGFSHSLLTWEGEKPSSRIQERARSARYGLLAACAEQIGADAIVTAHHADDQAETILFRLTRGSGVTGLAGMSPISKFGRMALLRPLLSLTKAQLVEICERRRHAFFQDPSNADETYARARLRKLMPLLAAEGLDAAALRRLGARAARADEGLDFCAQEVRRRAMLESGVDFARFDASMLRNPPVELLQRIIAAEIDRLAPAAPLRLDRLERAARRLHDALSTGVAIRLTLAGLMLDCGLHHLILRPAPPRRPHRREA